MSLLTSTNNPPEYTKFFNKMQRQFNKKSFLNQNYTVSPHLLNDINGDTRIAEELIHKQMQQFMSKLKKILTDYANHHIDYYFILAQMKGKDFFSQISTIFIKQLHEKYKNLEENNFKLKKQLNKVQQNFKILQNRQISNKPIKKDNVFHSFKSIGQNLYQKSKVMNPQQFIELCNKIILGQKIIIKKMSKDRQSQKNKSLVSEDNINYQQIAKEIAKIIQSENQGFLIQKTIKLEQQLKNWNNFKWPKICKNPCCRFIQNNNYVKSSKIITLRSSLEAKKNETCYKNDKSQQYFNRYYRKSDFDIKNVQSLQKSKLQQMMKLQQDYKYVIKNRQKLKVKR